MDEEDGSCGLEERWDDLLFPVAGGERLWCVGEDGGLKGLAGGRRQSRFGMNVTWTRWR